MALWVLGKPGLCSEFQDSPGYVERLCLKKSKQKFFWKNTSFMLTKELYQYFLICFLLVYVIWLLLFFYIYLFLDVRVLLHLLGDCRSVEIRGQLGGVGSLPPYGSLDSGGQVWQAGTFPLRADSRAMVTPNRCPRMDWHRLSNSNINNYWVFRSP